MNQKLKLKQNSDIVGHQSLFIANAALKKIAQRKSPDEFIYMNSEEVAALNIKGISGLFVEEMIVMDYGWLGYYEPGDPIAKKLNGIWNAQSDAQNCDRSRYVNCPSAIKGQRLVLITILLGGSPTEENFLVMNQKKKIVPCRFAELLSHNWDGDSEEAWLTTEDFLDDDFDLDNDYLNEMSEFLC